MNKANSPPNSSTSCLGGTNFLVSIYGHENMSLQGMIQWLDTGKKIHFRSTTELLALMEEAVYASISGEADKRTWKDTKHINVI